METWITLTHLLAQTEQIKLGTLVTPIPFPPPGIMAKMVSTLDYLSGGQYIENSFHTSDIYIIRYFSKPDKDLEILNNIIINFCTQNQKREFFHLLKVLKGGRYSDIDNYLIANSVEILERCEVRGFIIVSSDKDYLPVMRIASYKKIKSRILGINTSDIYEKYNIDDIKFLGIMKTITKCN